MSKWNLHGIMRALLVAGIAGMFAVGGSCDTGVTGGGFSGGGFNSGSSFGSNDVFDAGIIGLQGDLATSCGGFGCDFDFSDF